MSETKKTGHVLNIHYPPGFRILYQCGVCDEKISLTNIAHTLRCHCGTLYTFRVMVGKVAKREPWANVNPTLTLPEGYDDTIVSELDEDSN